MPPFKFVCPTNKIAHFVEVSLYFILSSTTSYLMYVICVQKKSETFENIFCKSIKAGQEDCFLIGVVLDEYMIYMPKMKNNVQDMQYQEMKTEFMEILKFIPLDDC